MIVCEIRRRDPFLVDFYCSIRPSVILPVPDLIALQQKIAFVKNGYDVDA